MKRFYNQTTPLQESIDALFIKPGDQVKYNSANAGVYGSIIMKNSITVYLPMPRPMRSDVTGVTVSGTGGLRIRPARGQPTVKNFDITADCTPDARLVKNVNMVTIEFKYETAHGLEFEQPFIARVKDLTLTFS